MHQWKQQVVLKTDWLLEMFQEKVVAEVQVSVEDVLIEMLQVLRELHLKLRVRCLEEVR